MIEHVGVAMSARKQDGRVDSLPGLFLNTLSLQPSSTRQEDPMKGTSVDAPSGEKRKKDGDGGPTPKAQKLNQWPICYHTVNVLGAEAGTRIRGIEVSDKKGVLYRNSDETITMTEKNQKFWTDSKGRLSNALSSVQGTVFEIVEGVIWPSTKDRTDV